jgi:hypothetical protein
MTRKTTQPDSLLNLRSVPARPWLVFHGMLVAIETTAGRPGVPGPRLRPGPRQATPQVSGDVRPIMGMPIRFVRSSLPFLAFCLVCCGCNREPWYHHTYGPLFHSEGFVYRFWYSTDCDARVAVVWLSYENSPYIFPSDRLFDRIRIESTSDTSPPLVYAWRGGEAVVPIPLSRVDAEMVINSLTCMEPKIKREDLETTDLWRNKVLPSLTHVGADETTRGRRLLTTRCSRRIHAVTPRACARSVPVRPAADRNVRRALS